MSNHTPGPWTNSEGMIGIYGWDQPEPPSGRGEPFLLIASVSDDGILNHNREVPVAEGMGAANAHLIAAAPEMYAILDRIETTIAEGMLIKSDITDEVSDVLHKARGGGMSANQHGASYYASPKFDSTRRARQKADTLVALYEEGHTLEKIGEATGFSTWMVAKILREKGVKMRSAGVKKGSQWSEKRRRKALPAKSACLLSDWLRGAV